MKTILSQLLIFLSSMSFTQSLNMNLLGVWNDTNITKNIRGETYNDVYGFEYNNREYAVIGSTIGAHIIDVTNPINLVEIDVVLGKYTGDVINRDMKVYNHHLYMVCDQGASSLQVVDLSFLPDSVHVVYDDNTILRNAHNLFIDSVNERMYVCGAWLSSSSSPVNLILDISTPSSPVILTNLNNDVSWWNQAIGYVHDMYLKNNIAYLNHLDGMAVVDFNNIYSPQLLGDISSYVDQGVNHSGWLNDNDTTYVMLDETFGKSVKILDVSDPTNMFVTDTFRANTDSIDIAHNGYFKDDFLYLSYYHSGIYVLDATNRNEVKLAGFYDTYNGPIGGVYRGCWGVYPYLPSGNILASDKTTGLYVLSLDYTLGIKRDINEQSTLLYPNPVTKGSYITFEETSRFTVYDMTGKVVISEMKGNSFSTETLKKGLYIIKSPKKSYRFIVN